MGWNTNPTGGGGSSVDLTPLERRLATLEASAVDSGIAIVASLPTSFTNYSAGAVIYDRTTNGIWESTGSSWELAQDDSKASLSTGFTQTEFAGMLACNPIGVSIYTHGGITDIDDYKNVFYANSGQPSGIYDNTVINGASRLSIVNQRHYHINTTPVMVTGIPVNLIGSGVQADSDVSVYPGALAGTSPYLALSGRNRVRVSFTMRSNLANGLVVSMERVRAGADDTTLIQSFSTTGAPSERPDQPPSVNPGDNVKTLTVDLVTPIIDYDEDDAYYFLWKCGAEADNAGTKITTYIEIERYN